MRSTVRLGRVAGVPVGVHWSVLVILALVTDALAAGILPASVHGEPAAVYWTVGIAVALAFFASLLAHELAHAFVARRHGVAVAGITLWMFGGATELAEEAPDASADLRIAAVGPAVSAGCGVVCAGAALGAHAAGLPAVIVTGLAWLGITNAVLAAFNMLPAAPLDGGRVLRALIWRRTGLRDDATVRAGRVGRGFGIGLVVLGLLTCVTTRDIVGGMWLAVVGWFLAAAAHAETISATVGESLGEIRVGEVMDPDWTALPAYQSVEVAAPRAAAAPEDFFPALDFEGRPVGVVTKVRLLAAVRAAPRDLRVRDVAMPVRATFLAAPEERLADVVRRTGALAPFFVVEDERLVGVVSPVAVDRARRQVLPVPAMSRTGA